MNVLIVCAHPNPKSFNKSIVDCVIDEFKARGDSVRCKDLYAENFNPILDESQLAMQTQGKLPDDVIKEQSDIEWADTIGIVYPLWWSGRPAILKGWFDRVLTNGFAFGYENGELRGFLSAKRALIIVTAGGAREEVGSSDEELINHTAESLGFCGLDDIQHMVLYSVPDVNDQTREQMLEEVALKVKHF